MQCQRGRDWHQYRRRITHLFGQGLSGSERGVFPYTPEERAAAKPESINYLIKIFSERSIRADGFRDGRYQEFVDMLEEEVGSGWPDVVDGYILENLSNEFQAMRAQA